MTGQNDVIAFDPRGVVETAPLGLAARVGSLGGLRLGVLDNTKWNAGRLLRKTVARLQGEFSFAAVNYYAHPNALACNGFQDEAIGGSRGAYDRRFSGT